MGHSKAHRGAIDDIAQFADRFIKGRLAGFEKDMRICLTPINSPSRKGKTHAYFPALAACFGAMEYFTALYRGNTRGIGWQQVADWAQAYLQQPDYDREKIRILVEAFRHSVAHRGIASGIWVDRNQGQGMGRKLTWKVLADARRPSCRLVEENGMLITDPPWPTTYTHRVHIHLRSLSVDIRKAAHLYRKAIVSDQALQQNFEACMRQLYPR